MATPVKYFLLPLVAVSSKNVMTWVDVMISVEVEEPCLRIIFRSTSSQALRKEVDLASEVREMTHIREKALKQRIANRYNSAIIPWIFQEGDLVLRRANIGPPSLGQGKLAANWEDPYRVVKVLGNRAYKLSTLLGSKVPRLWNSSNLRKFFIQCKPR